MIRHNKKLLYLRIFVFRLLIYPPPQNILQSTGGIYGPRTGCFRSIGKIDWGILPQYIYYTAEENGMSTKQGAYIGENVI